MPHRCIRPDRALDGLARLDEGARLAWHERKAEVGGLDEGEEGAAPGDVEAHRPGARDLDRAVEGVDERRDVPGGHPLADPAAALGGNLHEPSRRFEREAGDGLAHLHHAGFE